MLLVRITSSGIRASALVTGSILSNFYFFPLSFVSQFCVCILFHSCLHFCLCPCCVLVCILVCVLVFVLALVLVSFRFCVKKNLFEFCFKFCLGTIWLTKRILGLRGIVNLCAYLPIERIA